MRAAIDSLRTLMQRPRLSVIIPCHNDGDYLIDAVASVQRNAAEAELIIVDDGSTQLRTREVLTALGEAGHRVLEQPHGGLSAARNAGIAASAGDYFLPLDADNRLLPGFATEAIALLDADSGAGVVYGDRREFGMRSGDVTVPEFDLPRMLSANYIDACAVARREVWSEAGGYDVTLDIWEDWDLWLGAAARGWRFIRIPRPTFEYRVRPDSVHQRFLRRTDYVPALRRVYDKVPELVSERAVEILIAAHVERRQLFADATALRDSRDAIQAEIDRLALGRREEIAARDAELASVKFVLQARDEELRNLQSVDRPDLSIAATEPSLTDATQVFTIIARNYLAHARVLAASLARHNPNSRLKVVVLDDPDRCTSAEPAFDIIHIDEVPFDPPSDLYTMAATYDVTELATAVKPWAFEHLFARGASVAIYLDPDIEVFDSLGPLEPLARAHGMILTPHVTAPLPQDGKHPDERDLLLSGIYNLGFLALSAEAARTFLPWWRARLRRDCLNDTTHGLFVDQRWIDLAPSLFEPAILKDPGYNVAYWNLPHRVLTRDGDRILVQGDGGVRPLRFFHFSGFSPRTPHLLSKHQLASPRIRLSEAPLLADLCSRYAAALEEVGFADCDALPYGFAMTATGLPLDARARRTLLRTYVEDEARDGAASFPNPFSPAGADDVVQRLLRPSPHASAVPAYLGEIWSERADLRVAFPHIDSTDAERFLDWVRTQGVREHQIPPQLIPPRVPPPSVQPVRNDTKLTPGVNVYGYAYSESGTGQIVRAVVAALAAEGIPYAVVPFTRTVSRQEREFRDLGAPVPSFDTNLLCINADPLPLFFEEMRGQLPAGASNIGLWAWEVEDLPAVMAQSESYLDEVWGISSFTAAALSRSLTKPVRAFPLPVVVPEAAFLRPRARAELGMPEGFLFLFCFDYDSVFRRKNPLAAVAAFRQAFADRPEVVLYIKTTNAERHVAEDEELRTAAAGASNIVIRDGYVSSDDYFSMLDACDCYVSLHRSEGFGLTVAEAMALGKPVISTAYSSTLEFANESNSFLVPAQLTEVGDNAAPYPPHSRWAEPDVAAAAQQMARVYADPAAAAAVGARARADIQTLHSPRARGPLLRRLLDEQRRSAKEAVTMHASVQTTEDTIESPVPFEMNAFETDAFAAESLLRSPRPDLPSPMQRLITPLRRLVLRCIRVYWVQQLAINHALLAAMRTLRRESRAESASQAALLVQQKDAHERTAAETARMREELTELAADIHALRERIAALTPAAEPRARQTVLSDDERAVRRQTDG
jgi:glycosyltransferase involved in cell wall biosynthesis